MPKTFFVNERGVIQNLTDWEKQIKPANQLAPVTDVIRGQWSQPGDRLSPAALAALVASHADHGADLKTAVELASRYLDLQLRTEAQSVLQETVAHYEARQVANAGDAANTKLLGQAYFQLARACSDNRSDQVRYATRAFYLNPTVGFGKQIARLIAPKKFDHRPDGRFDNDFREATLRRLKRERQAWLEGP